MTKNSTNPKHKDKEKALIVEKLAEKHHVTKPYVYMVLRDSRVNEKIFADYFEMKEALERVFYRPLLSSINDLVPFS